MRALPAPPAQRLSFAESLAGADTAADAERRRGLRRMKIVALSFLVGATVLFLACRWAEANGAGAWAGYVAAASEAGMVGALADWFAVTALFKHPLGIPIPHTAIIKRKKDQLGEGLGAFVRENFMSPEVVETKLRDAEVAGRLGKWMSEPAHAERVAAEASTVLRVGVEMLRDEDVQHVLDRMIVKRHRRAAVGAAGRPGAGHAAGRASPGSADPAAGRPGVPVVAERGRDHRAGGGARLADLVAALGGPPGRRPDPPRADGLHRQGAPQPRPRAAPLGHPLPLRVRRRPAARRGDDRAGREGQGAADGARRGRPRRGDGLEHRSNA